MPLSPTLSVADFELVKDVARALSIASIALALVPLATFVKFKNEYPARLPANFCVAAIGLCLAILSGIVDADACYGQAIAIQYFGIVMIAWWFIISLNVFLLVTNRPYAHLERTYMVCGWLLPLLFAIVPLMLNVYQTDSRVWGAAVSSSSSPQALTAPVSVAGSSAGSLHARLSHSIAASSSFSSSVVSSLPSSSFVSSSPSSSPPPNATGAPTNWECWLVERNGSPWPVYVFFDGWMCAACLVGLPLWVWSMQRVYQLHRASASMQPTSRSRSNSEAAIAANASSSASSSAFSAAASFEVPRRLSNAGYASMDATYGNHSAAAVVSAFSANQPLIAASGLPSALAYAQSNPHAQGNQGNGSDNSSGSPSDLSAAVILASYVRHLAFVLLFFAVFLVSIVFRSISYFGTLTFAPLIAHTIAICGAGAYCFLIFGVSRRNYELWRDYFDGVCCAGANRSSRANSSASSSSSSSSSYGGGNYGEGAASRLVIADPASPLVGGARGGAASISGLPGSPSVHASGASGYSRPYVGAGPHSPLHMASRYAQLAKNGGNASPVFGPLR